MKMIINDTRRIVDVKHDFQQLFPYLKLEFFMLPHITGKGSPQKQVWKDYLSIGEIRNVHREGNLTIIPELTVAQLEQRFKTLYGLSVQVFRKSGNIWLETTVTDSWTLQEQNSEGESFARHLKEKEEDVRKDRTDTDEQ